MRHLALLLLLLPAALLGCDNAPVVVQQGPTEIVLDLHSRGGWLCLDLAARQPALVQWFVDTREGESVWHDYQGDVQAQRGQRLRLERRGPLRVRLRGQTRGGEPVEVWCQQVRVER